MRLETQEHGIKVTAIVPGSTLTASWEGTTVDKNRFILPEDIAAAIITAYKMSPGANVEEIVMKPVFGQV
jgi:NADP-dependent 3-hydroxy acid dehydrogenase YdfG